MATDGRCLGLSAPCSGRIRARARSRTAGGRAGAWTERRWTSGSARIWGWMFFDWAQQPYATLGLTFIFAPYFASVAAGHFVAAGTAQARPTPQAQSLWSAAQTLSGLVIALTGAGAGGLGRLLRAQAALVLGFPLVTVVCAIGLWGLRPDGTGLISALVLFWVGYTASECAFNLNNAILPSLGIARGGRPDLGRGDGVRLLGRRAVAVRDAAVLCRERAGRDAAGGAARARPRPRARARGRGSSGRSSALWFAVFMIPFFLWIRDDPPLFRAVPASARCCPSWRDASARSRRRRSYASFLVGSMLYRDALTALYCFGGIYATLVLGWQTVQVGVFGIIAAIAAAIADLDRRHRRPAAWAEAGDRRLLLGADRGLLDHRRHVAAEPVRPAAGRRLASCRTSSSTSAARPSAAPAARSIPRRARMMVRHADPEHRPRRSACSR